MDGKYDSIFFKYLISLINRIGFSYLTDYQYMAKNPNVILDQKKTFGQKAADTVAAVMGSWKFLIIQTCILITWITLNIIGWVQHWDPYPFILLNLTLSFQAAYATPIILMSQNRQSETDRIRAELDYATDTKAEKEIESIHHHLQRIEDHRLDEILKKLDHLEKQLKKN